MCYPTTKSLKNYFGVITCLLYRSEPRAVNITNKYIYLHDFLTRIKCENEITIQALLMNMQMHQTPNPGEEYPICIQFRPGILIFHITYNWILELYLNLPYTSIPNILFFNPMTRVSKIFLVINFEILFQNWNGYHV